MHGQGVSTGSKGVKYEGEFKKGEPHGRGRAELADGFADFASK